MSGRIRRRAALRRQVSSELCLPPLCGSFSFLSKSWGLRRLASQAVTFRRFAAKDRSVLEPADWLN